MDFKFTNRFFKIIFQNKIIQMYFFSLSFFKSSLNKYSRNNLIVLSSLNLIARFWFRVSTDFTNYTMRKSLLSLDYQKKKKRFILQNNVGTFYPLNHNNITIQQALLPKYNVILIWGSTSFCLRYSLHCNVLILQPAFR